MTGEPSEHRAEELGDVAGTVLATVKPRLRGWVHAGAAPLAVAAGTALVALAPTATARSATAVFAVTAVLLFGTSAVYHRGTWSPRTGLLLKRLDHSNIFLIIAGTYTPFAVLLLPRSSASTLLAVVWSGAVAGVLFRVLWTGAPRWLYVPVYVAMGWIAVAYLPAFWRTGGPAVALLVVAGGLLYSAGALVYGFRRPDPSPRWFGFHEVFHVLTVVAFAAHATGVGLALAAA
ncbi:hemolysin III family protein [Quadrisphaera sp. DSM 44207]|uniref:PAQR family membrane homeostasis protein TrhA n=1 Tax=Quadrisphaera sp. DSM 44207 TaxID=1881057 RepID=UPI00089047EC|nr:hemolysin III family protein [Quadrisphaera sp. DSM 44207]SDQ69521.1 hemolysin III [Quadrisphaera sp. DSM 44207]